MKIGKMVIAGTAIAGAIASVIAYFLFPPSPPMDMNAAVYSIPDDVQDTADEIEIQLSGARIKLPRRRLIGSVELEKETVCPGEGLLVRATPRNGEGRVMFKIGSKPGNPVIVSFLKPGRKRLPVLATVPSRAFDIVSRTVQVLPGNAPGCRGQDRFRIHARVLGADPHRVRFRLISTDGNQSPRKAGKTTWSFGDGTNTQAGAVVEHGYGLREQTGPASSFIVSARPPGRKSFIRTSLFLPNTNYLDKTRGTPTLPVDYDGFPRKSGKTYIARIKVKNIEKANLRLKTVRLRMQGCRDDAPVRIRETPVEKIFGASVVSPGSVLAHSLRLDESMLGPDVCRVEILVRADTDPPRAGKLVDMGPRKGDLKYGETLGRIELVLRNPFAALRRKQK